MKRLLLVFLVTHSFNALAQQIPLTNLYNYNTYQVFSAYAGREKFFEGALDYRKQWTGISGTPETILMTAALQASKKVGVGLKVQRDNSGIISQTRMLGNYSYHIPLADHHTLSMALGIGFTQTHINSGKVIGNSNDPALAANNSITFANEFSALYNFREWEIALSVPNLIDQTADNGLKTNKRHVIVYAKNDFEISPSFDLEPSLMVRAVGGVHPQIDINCLAKWKKNYSFGFGYRDHAGLIVKLGMKVQYFMSISYAYEFFGAGFPSYSFGSHQIQLKANILRPEPSGRVVPRKSFFNRALLKFRR